MGRGFESLRWLQNYSVGFPSGQREQTVNLPAKPSEVRILPPPPFLRLNVGDFVNIGIKLTTWLKFNQINTSAGIFSMTMKTAVTVGEIYHTVIGQKGKQAQYIYTAPIFEEAKNALHHAIPGQVLISDYAIAKACGIELEEPQKLYSPISRTTKSISKVGYEPIDIKNISVRDKIRLTEFLSSFVPKEIFRNLHVQGKISEGDRRRVTILALSFEGINFQNEKTTKIQNYLTSIFDTVEETSGYIFNILSDISS